MFSLPIGLLIAISVVTSAANGILQGKFSKKYADTAVNLWRYNFYLYGACFIGILVLCMVSETDFTVSWFSVGLGALFAVTVLLSILFRIKAQAVGTVTYASVIISLSAIIPTFSGLLFFHESVTWIQCIGVGMMIACVLLSNEKKEEAAKIANWKFLVFVMISFLMSGGLGVVQKTHQYSEIHRGEMPVFLLTCFLICTVFSLVWYLAEKRKEQKFVSPENHSGGFSLLIPIVAGACYAFPHTINLFLSGKLPSIIFFPVINILPTVLLMLYALIFLKERFSVKQWCGIAVGIGATVLVSGIIG